MRRFLCIWWLLYFTVVLHIQAVISTMSNSQATVLQSYRSSRQWVLLTVLAVLAGSFVGPWTTCQAFHSQIRREEVECKLQYNYIICQLLDIISPPFSNSWSWILLKYFSTTLSCLTKMALFDSNFITFAISFLSAGWAQKQASSVESRVCGTNHILRRY